MELNFNQRRVLGVLMEKSYTTPEQYPLTLNALVTGSNQKSCRDPVAHLDEESVYDALDVLRDRELAAVVRTAGGRTDRFRHKVADAWQLEGKQAAVLAELLLRGPQTDGELRQRASRMVRIDSLPELAEVIRSLQEHDPPFVRRLSPEGQKRGAKFAHTLYPAGKEPALETGPTAEEAPAPTSSKPAASPVYSRDVVDELRERIAELEERVSKLEEAR